MAILKIQTQGVKGGNTNTKEVGYSMVSIDETTRISVDNFEGYGNDYKERATPLIEIIENGVNLFSGTFDELKKKLNE